MEVLFHSKAFTSCAVASSHVCPREAKSAVVELRLHSRYNPKPKLSCQTNVSTLHPYLRECDMGGGVILTPPLPVAQIQYLLQCGQPVSCCEDGKKQRVRRALKSLTQKLSICLFCTGKCNWTRLQDCTHLIQLAARLQTNWNIIDCRPHDCNDPHANTHQCSACESLLLNADSAHGACISSNVCCEKLWHFLQKPFYFRRL